jgi:hypothetical protein
MARFHLFRYGFVLATHADARASARPACLVWHDLPIQVRRYVV